MTYYFRVLYNILEGYLHKRDEIVPDAHWYSRVGISDIDMFFHMNNASYFRVAEYARWSWIH